MAIKGLKLSKDEVSQTIDIKSFTGVDLDPITMEQIGQDLIDLIVDRTRDGKDVNGKSFAGYDKDYIDSTEFKAFGKSNSERNMTLEGTMLADLSVIEVTDQDLIIGHEDKNETLKAFNHNTGDTVPTRAYFGVTDSEIESVLDTFQNEISISKQENEEADENNALTELLLARAITADRADALRNSADNLFDEIFGNNPFEGF